MKSSNSHKPPICTRSGIAALVVAMSAAIGTGTVHAAGTASGTSIDNLSTLNYSVGGVAQTPIGSAQGGNSSGPGSPTSFVVDNRVNVAVATTNGTFVSVVPGAAAQVTTFTVTNTGNTVQDFALTSVQAANGQNQFGVDNSDTGACSQVVENGTNVGYQPLEDTATFIDELAADGIRTVYVLCAIPAGATNGQHAVVGLIAQARAGASPGGAVGAILTQSAADTAGVDIVFGDVAGLDDGARDAQHSARSAYRVVSSTLTVTKTSTLVCDPFNGNTNPKRIPGSIVRWTITIANTGAASASLGTVTDTINALTTFDANLVTGVGAGSVCLSAAPGVPESAAGSGFKLDVLADTRPGTYPKFFTTANDADGANLNAGVVTVNYAVAMPVEVGYAAGELKAGESVVVYFNVTVN